MIFSPLQGVESYRFSNGLRIYLKEDHQWPLVSAHAWVRVGSVDESPSQAGIAHVLEHMVFKGTDHLQAAEISGFVEALGGAMNAETTKEYTHYYIDVPRAGTSKAIHLLGELLHRATLDPSEWERECPVILEEIKRRNDDPDSLLWDLLNEAMFDESSLRRPVIGSPETVAAITPQDLRTFYEKHYTTPQCVMVITGDFKTDKMLKELRREFEAMPQGSANTNRFKGPPSGALRRVAVRKPVKQDYLAFGFRTPPAVHPDHEALDLLAGILGDGRNSRLVRSLREKKRLVWSISAANMTHEGPGLFAIFAEADSKKSRQLTPALMQLLKKLLEQPPTESELERVKNMIQTSWLQGYETYHSQASTLGLFAIDDHLERLTQYLPKLLGLTRRHLSQVIEKYFHPLALAAAIIES